jgi:SAM-dependent methyltransferase
MTTSGLYYTARRLRQRLRRWMRPGLLGPARRTRPLSGDFGYDRGTPVDRYYIERFLAEHRSDIRGRVLEIKEPLYARRFGGHVTGIEILDIDPENPRATLVADLAAADAVPSDIVDCFILTQTLQLIYQVEAAVRHAHRVLRPGGVLLATVPAVSRLAFPPDRGPDYWRFTAAACTRLFSDVFGANHVTVRAHGNVLTCAAFLMGMALEELRRSELETEDPLFPLLVTIRAVKR